MGNRGKAAKKTPNPESRIIFQIHSMGPAFYTLYSAMHKQDMQSLEMEKSKSQSFWWHKPLGKIITIIINQNRVPGVDLVLSSPCTQNNDRSISAR